MYFLKLCFSTLTISHWLENKNIYYWEANKKKGQDIDGTFFLFKSRWPMFLIMFAFTLLGSGLFEATCDSIVSVGETAGDDKLAVIYTAKHQGSKKVCYFSLDFVRSLFPTLNCRI